MKYLFVALLCVMIGATIITILKSPDMQSDIPVLYWVTDPNPARGPQIATFHRWMVKQGHVEEHVLKTVEDVHNFRSYKLMPSIIDAIVAVEPHTAIVWKGEVTEADLPITVKVPKFELRTDSANRDISKQIIQGVSGVAGDIMDVGDLDIPFMVNVGLLEDLTDVAEEMGFDTSKTWEAVRAALMVADDHGHERQYAFPCNVYANAFWVNRKVFLDHGLEPPPSQWTFEEFEEYGNRLTAIANKGLSHNQTFFVDSLHITELLRSRALSLFNETLTRSTFDDPRTVEVLKLMKKWRYDQNIVPTEADIRSFSVDTGYGGGGAQLFNSGNYAMFRMGRYALIQLRIFNEERASRGQPLLDLAVAESPHGGFRNVVIGTRAAGVYAGGKHKDLAMLFLSYLASEDYNLLLVDDADSLPSNPQFAAIEEFRRPSKYPNEWEVHQPWADLEAIGIPQTHSPYVLSRTSSGLTNNMAAFYYTGQMTAEQAAAEGARRVNEEIRQTLKDRRSLVPRYEAALERQAKIDEMVAVWREIEQLEKQGKQVPQQLRDMATPIPLSWIDNVFYRVYYKQKGWAQEHVTE